MNEAITSLNIENQINKDEFASNMRAFFEKSAKAWQSYISYEFIDGIKLSEPQKRVLSVENSQMIINGSAGSGKSIVLLYKFFKSMIEEKEPKRFLYITFNQTLIDDTVKRANMYKDFDFLKKKHEEVLICTFHSLAAELLKELGYTNIENIKVDYTNIEKMREKAFRRISSIVYKYKEKGPEYNKLYDEEKFYKTHDEEFIRDEILWMKANGYITLESYMECERAGRGNTPRLTKSQRKTIFKIYEEYSESARLGKWKKISVDLEEYALVLLKKFEEIPDEKKFDYIYVDEVQDFDAMQLKFLAILAKKSLVLAGDPKQKIYKRTPHSYIDLGIDIKNSFRELNENFRTTEEIMKLANSLKFTSDVKDNAKIKYMKTGEKPKIVYFDKWEKAFSNLGRKIKHIQEVEPQATIAIITREESSKAAGNLSNIKTNLGQYCSITSIEQYGYKFNFNKKRQVVYTDLFNVKGLEFDYVFLLQFDKNHYPSKKVINSFEKYTNKRDIVEKGSDQYKDKNELIGLEKKRLYVAMSRAKKYLEMICVTNTEHGISEFIEDFSNEDYDYEVIKTKRSVIR